MRICLRASAVLLCVAALGSLGQGRVTAAEPEPVAPTASAGAAHRARGAEHFGQGEYDAAISEFRKAYELEADPAVLYDIALAYQELGVPERARFFYRRYLSVAPAATNRAEVEGRLEALDRLLPALPPPAPSASPSPGPGPATELTAPSPPPEPARPSIFHRWWFWTAVGAVATGAALTVLVLRRSHDDDLPASNLGGAKFF